MKKKIRTCYASKGKKGGKLLQVCFSFQVMMQVREYPLNKTPSKKGGFFLAQIPYM